MSIEVTAPPPIPPNRIFASIERPGLVEKLVVPGSIVSTTSGFMRGHGTFIRGSDLVASLAGTVQQVNRLVSVKSVKTRYSGEIGDVVIGRIVDVQQKRWKVDTNSRLFSNLLLSSINLPGGEVRRKSVEDELMMREYLKEGDLISAEVQQIHHDGVLSLHTRNLKYGKLAQGILVKVPAYLVKRRKTHFHSLPCGAAVIIGCNGLIWICPELSEDPDGGYNQNLEEVIAPETRKAMSRLAASIRLLADHCVNIHDATILAVFECSLSYEVRELLQPSVAASVMNESLNKIQIEADK